MTAAPVLALVHFDSWAGRTAAQCEILGTCARKGKPHYKVRLLESHLRHRQGKVLYPPVWAVTLKETQS